MNIFQAGATIAIVGLLSACAQQEEHLTMVSPQPVFDKYGEGSCEEGYIYVPGAAQVPRCVPEDECIEETGLTAANIPCPPPYQRPDDGDDDSTRTGQNPFGAAAGN